MQSFQKKEYESRIICVFEETLYKSLVLNDMKKRNWFILCHLQWLLLS